MVTVDCPQCGREQDVGQGCARERVVCSSCGCVIAVPPRPPAVAEQRPDAAPPLAEVADRRPAARVPWALISVILGLLVIASRVAKLVIDMDGAVSSPPAGQRAARKQKTRPKPQTAKGLLEEIDAAIAEGRRGRNAARFQPPRPREEYVADLAAMGAPAADVVIRYAYREAGSRFTQEVARDALTRMGPEAIGGLLRWGGRDWSNMLGMDTAYRAVTRVRDMGAPAVPKLIAVLETETDPPARALAAVCLGHLGWRKDRHSAKGGLPRSHSWPWALRPPGDGVCRERAQRAIPALTKALGDADPKVRQYATVALVVLSGVTQETMPHLLTVLTTGDRGAAGFMFQQLALAPAVAQQHVAALAEVLTGKEIRRGRGWEERAMPLAELLAGMGAKLNPVIPHLLEALDRDPSLHDTLTSLFMGAARRPDKTVEPVRVPASQVPRLRAWLQSPDQSRRVLAIRCACLMGPGGRPLLPQLWPASLIVTGHVSDRRPIRSQFRRVGGFTDTHVGPFLDAIVGIEPSVKKHVSALAGAWLRMYGYHGLVVWRLNALSASEIDKAYLSVLDVSRPYDSPRRRLQHLDLLGPEDRVLLPLLVEILKHKSRGAEVVDVIHRVDPGGATVLRMLVPDALLHDGRATRLVQRYGTEVVSRALVSYFAGAHEDRGDHGLEAAMKLLAMNEYADQAVAFILDRVLRSAPSAFEKRAAEGFPDLPKPARTRLALAMLPVILGRTSSSSSSPQGYRVRRFIGYLGKLGAKDPRIAAQLWKHIRSQPPHKVEGHWYVLIRSSDPEKIDLSRLENLLPSRHFSLRDRQAAVRVLATPELAHRGVPIIVRHLSDERLLTHALDPLGRLGPKAAAAVGALEKWRDELRAPGKKPTHLLPKIERVLEQIRPGKSRQPAKP